MDNKIKLTASDLRRHRLVRGAWWLAWVPLFILAALYVGLHIPGALLILAIKDDCAASRWLHNSTDWALDGIWKICPANVLFVYRSGGKCRAAL